MKNLATKLKLIICALILALTLTTGCASKDVEDIFRFEVRTLDLTVGESANLQIILGNFSTSEEIVFHPSQQGIVELQGTDTTYYLRDTITGEDSAMRVIAKEQGTIQLTAYLKSNSNVRDTIDITVTNERIGQMKITGNATMRIGSTQTLSVTVLPSHLPNTVVWSSSNEAIATVDQNGVVSALRGGNVSIIATSTHDSSMNAMLNIQISYAQATGVSITGPDTVEVDTPVRFTATVFPDTADQNNVTWTANGGTIDANGLFTATEPGRTVIITARAGSQTITKTITTTYQHATLIEIEGVNRTVYDDEDVTLTVRIYPSRTDAPQWSSDNESVATVDQTGHLTLHAHGEVTITATDVLSGNKDSVTLTVTSRPAPDEVIVSTEADSQGEETVEMYPDASIQLYVLTEPDDALKTVTWSSSNPNLATVDENGIVTTLNVGSVTITATSANQKSGSFTITVVKRPDATSMTVVNQETNENVDEISLYLDEKLSLAITTEPALATTRAKYTVGDATIVSVSANGEVVPLKAGTTTITVTPDDDSTLSQVINVVVKARPLASSITVTDGTDDVENSYSVAVGAEAFFEIIVSPNDALQQYSITFSDSTIITYEEDEGMIFITGVSAGTTVLTITSEDKAIEVRITLTVTE